MLERRVRIDRERLEVMMRLRKMTNKELAEKSGLSYNAILRIKREQSTSLEGLQRTCDALDCHPFDLIVAEGYPEPFLAIPVSP